ncbi:hypothetical protein I3843_10G106900 [Carya illinoinensis]|nr:hypothetical protein I3843_10G106900 [Carya illinoinensis]
MHHQWNHHVKSFLPMSFFSPNSHSFSDGSSHTHVRLHRRAPPYTATHGVSPPPLCSSHHHELPQEISWPTELCVALTLPHSPRPKMASNGQSAAVSHRMATTSPPQLHHMFLYLSLACHEVLWSSTTSSKHPPFGFTVHGMMPPCSATFDHHEATMSLPRPRLAFPKLKLPLYVVDSHRTRCYRHVRSSDA